MIKKFHSMRNAHRTAAPNNQLERRPKSLQDFPNSLACSRHKVKGELWEACDIVATKVKFADGVVDFHLTGYVEVGGMEDAPHEPSAPLATYIIHDTSFRKAIGVIVQGVADRVVHIHLSKRQRDQSQIDKFNPKIRSQWMTSFIGPAKCHPPRHLNVIHCTSEMSSQVPAEYHPLSQRIVILRASGVSFTETTKCHPWSQRRDIYPTSNGSFIAPPGGFPLYSM